MTTIESRVSFRVPSKVLYECFLNENDLTRLSLGSKCEMVSSDSFSFILFPPSFVSIMWIIETVMGRWVKNKEGNFRLVDLSIY